MSVLKWKAKVLEKNARPLTYLLLFNFSLIPMGKVIVTTAGIFSSPNLIYISSNDIIWEIWI